MNIEIYSKQDCKYCTMAKALLNSKSMEYKEYKLDDDITRDELIQKFPTAKTFPIITMDNVYIGGYDQLKLKL